VVNPYGEDTLVFELSARNAGPEGLVLLPQQATLAVGADKSRKARTLDDYRKRWPAWAAVGAEQLADRDFAYHAVLETLLIERLVPAGGEAKGRLAFPTGVVLSGAEMALALPYRVARHEAVATLRWRLE
jgi:hypothetical protein